MFARCDFPKHNDLGTRLGKFTQNSNLSSAFLQTQPFLGVAVGNPAHRLLLWGWKVCVGTDWQSFVGALGNAAGRVQGREQGIFIVVLFYKRHVDSYTFGGISYSAKMCKTFFYLPSSVLTGPVLIPALPPTFRNCSDPKM